MQNKLPPPDRPLTIDADDEPGRRAAAEQLAAVRTRMAKRVFHVSLLEKYALIALVSIIFGQLLGVRPDPLELSLLVGVVIVANAALSTWLQRFGFGPGPALRQFIVTGMLNVAIVAVLLLVFDVLGDPADPATLGFFVLLVTLLVTLYDRYRPEYLARFEEVGQTSAT